MKFQVLAYAFALAIAIVSAVPAAAPWPAKYSLSKRATTASGTGFSIGKFAGVNVYWLALVSNSDIDTVIGHLKTSGIKVIRVWGFNDVTDTSSGTYFQSFSSSGATINTGTNGLQRLDYVVKAAAAAGIQIIIPFVNNWSDFGGMKAYLTYCGGDQKGWYTNDKCQTAYQAYIKAVVSRYSGSGGDGIFAWELANEPRCNGCETSVITNWATKTAAYIKSLDSTHMVCMGDEGFGLSGSTDYPYTKGEGLDFAANLAIKDIDFGTLHLYPDGWGQSDSNDWGSKYIQAHADIGKQVGKPVILEEYGSKTHSNEKAWQATAISSGIAGDLIWQYEDSSVGTGYTSDGYQIQYGTSDYSTYVDAHIKAMAGG